MSFQNLQFTFSRIFRTVFVCIMSLRKYLYKVILGNIWRIFRIQCFPIAVGKYIFKAKNKQTYCLFFVQKLFPLVFHRKLFLHLFKKKQENDLKYSFSQFQRKSCIDQGHHVQIKTKKPILQTQNSRIQYIVYIENSKQRTLCVTLLKKAKKKYYKDLKLFDINDNEKFWKKVKPLFDEEVKGNNAITLVEGNKLITDNKKFMARY